MVNAIACWKGSAFAVPLRTEAWVELRREKGVSGSAPGVDPGLIVRSVELVLEHYQYQGGAHVRTQSEIPPASGLKSSSAAANAAVLAALDALGQEMEPLEATRLGVQAALEMKVTITGAFDDACASMLGGVVVTDNKEMTLLKRQELSSPVLLMVPEEHLLSRDTDVRRSRTMAPLVDLAVDLALKGDYPRAMTLNGIAYCAALRRSPDPIFAALESGALGATLSGTGPSYAALVDPGHLEEVQDSWKALGKTVIRTEIDNNGARTGRRSLIGSCGETPGSAEDR